MNSSKISSRNIGLDTKFGSFAPGQLFVLAGRPMMGKRDLMLKIAAAISDNFPVLFYSLDSSRETLEKHYDLAKIEVDSTMCDLTKKRLTWLFRFRKYTVLIVNYIQLLPVNMIQDLHFFKEFAKENNTCIVLISQLDRTCEQREDQRPTLEDVKLMFRDHEQLMLQTDGIFGVYNTNRFEQDSHAKLASVELIQFT